ncbi:MAG: sigma-54-dependent Fis family transcriptional regulator [Planctomycetes bacterium]|nr:sigma-54-dependent Fis family transcriptional regulator [Planctomycetota bacterium]
MSKILVVDDEANVRDAFQELLTAEGHTVVTARNAETAMASIAAEQPSVAIFDVCMPGMNGLDALRRVKESHPHLPVIIMTGQGTMETAIEATKRGAFDYQLKPFDPEEMLGAVGRALEGVRVMQRQVALDPQTAFPTGDAIIGQSTGMQAVFKAIGRAAPTDAAVLIRGESGTGKELVARAIYQHSRRSSASLYVVNCAAIPETLLESELFGHERGAFTGAHTRRIGKLEQADGGTVFLDEIGDIPLSVQAKLLRLLQEKTLERIGSNETIRLNVRVLAATNRNLEQAIADGDFREDLYHRLNVVTIRLPPLRDRREDIPRLVNYFLDLFCREEKLDKPPLSDEARSVLQGYSWPGNVRELEHCIRRTLIFTGGHPIQATDVRQALSSGTEQSSGDTASMGALTDFVCKYLDKYTGTRAHEDLLESVERLLLIEALERTQGNRSQAARLLGLARPTFHAKLQRYGLREGRE